MSIAPPRDEAELVSRAALHEAYSDLGANAIYSKQYDQARAYYQSAQSLAHGQNDFVTEAQARLSIAMLFKREGKLNEAIAEAEASAALLKNISQEPMVAEVATRLAELKEYSGDTSGAIAGYQQAAKIFKEAGSAHRTQRGGRKGGRALRHRAGKKRACEALRHRHRGTPGRSAQEVPWPEGGGGGFFPV